MCFLWLISLFNERDHFHRFEPFAAVSSLISLGANETHNTVLMHRVGVLSRRLCHATKDTDGSIIFSPSRSGYALSGSAGSVLRHLP